MGPQEQQLLYSTLILRSLMRQGESALSSEYVPHTDAAAVVTSSQHVWCNIRHALHILPAKDALVVRVPEYGATPVAPDLCSIA